MSPRAWLAAAGLAMCLISAGPAQAGPDPCTASGTSRTCEGDQSGGIEFTTGVATLTVQNLTTNIDPGIPPSIPFIFPNRTHGIHLSSAGADGGNSANGSAPLPLILNVLDPDRSIVASGMPNDGTFINFEILPPPFTIPIIIPIILPSAHGIVVHNRGGDGGDGVTIFARDGGNGADGSAITITNFGDITTTGGYGQGIYAQSRGGDGGKGRDGTLGAGDGGDGGAGGNGGAVTVTSHGAITTLGNGARGIFARSLSGNGGAGGLGGGLFGGGGAGSTTGRGGTVTVSNFGAIDTQGSDAYGIHTQSIGGFAGEGGDSNALIGRGGDSDSGGDGGMARITNRDTVTTAGGRAHALFSQSIGGGGGSGGSQSGPLHGASGGLGGHGGIVIIDNTSLLSTSGHHAAAILAQSVGGGGGDGGFSSFVFFSYGGSGGAGGNAGSVNVTNGGALETRGFGASAILAQSVGGGGGNGGDTITASPNFAWGIGGSGGQGGNGGKVEIVNLPSIDPDGQGSKISTTGDRSHGILAKSVGGGGGSGGFAGSVSAGPGASLSIAVGGTGGSGGSGDSVKIRGASDIDTEGDDSHGIVALSIGGGGGSGGASIGVAASDQYAVTLTVGGKGGAGGNGGSVELGSTTNPAVEEEFTTGKITTKGEGSVGILALSIGGGGGNGGFRIAGSGAGSGAVTLNFGSNGGTGGDSGSVTLRSANDITTLGNESHGVQAQSLGGGGGNGGFSIALAGAGTAAGNLSLGAVGGSGGNSKPIFIKNLGMIDTFGEKSIGIFAQSIGGGGGNGGFRFSGSGAQTAAVNLTFRGGGGGAGVGANVTVENMGSIHTRGNGAYGIFGESIGGGGGSGGHSVAFGASVSSATKVFNVSTDITVGGKGGVGNMGGVVVINNQNSIATEGKNANAIYAKSVGGGGGDGGSSVNLTLDLDLSPQKNNSVGLDVTVGGDGGTGGLGREVTVSNFSALTTSGDQSHGIYVQSIGGGGGNGGKADTISLSTNDIVNLPHELPTKAKIPWSKMEGNSWSAEFNIGGSGGDANNGGDVRIYNHDDVSTSGMYARGLFAQSVGGGGGTITAGILGAAGEWLDGAGDVLDAAKLAIAIKDLFKKDPSGLIPDGLTINVGGNGGDNGNAGLVQVDNTGSIHTRGLEAHAIFAQSIGGGGGEAQLYAKGEGTGGDADVGITVAGDFAIGGKGGAAGNGGTVDVDHAGDITTWGEFANGVFAQSIGGGGGQSGGVAGGFSGFTSIGLGVGFRRDGGNGGNGGTVDVATNGTITTHGRRAAGILAQSIGGGGGIVGDGSKLFGEGIAFLGSVGGAGSAGKVTIIHNGEIETFGDESHGIFAQSAGGEGTGGKVSVTLNSGVTAHGADAHGIVAQSRGNLGADDITVMLQNNSHVLAGSGEGKGVAMLEGKTNLLTNHGNVATLQGVAGTAVFASTGNDTVFNHGLVTGSVDLGLGTNALHNETGSRWNAGATANLNGGALNNAGTLAPGGASAVQTTAVTGNLTQTGSGIYAFDLNGSDYGTDRLDISGTGRFAGTAELTVTRTGRLRSGTRQLTIASAAGGMTDDGITLDHRPSSVNQYRLIFEDVDHEDLLLEITTDFSPNRNGHNVLSPNQNVLANYISAIQDAGGTDAMEPVVEHLVNQPDDASLAYAYDHLSPAPLLSADSVSIAANLRFNNAMLSCRQREEPDRFVREGECSWFQALGRRIDRDPTINASGFREEAFELSGGAQHALDETWHAGWALAYEHSRLNLDASLGHSDGDRFHVGAMLKGNFGSTTLSTGITLGYGRYDSDRNTGLPAPNAVAESTQKLSSIGLSLRLARIHEQDGDWYLRPMVDAGVNFVNYRGFQESGAGGANLIVRRRSETFPSLQPAMEVGRELKRPDGTLLRPYGRLGVTHFFSGTSPQITATFEGAPQTIEPFSVQGENEQTLGDLTLGFDMLRPNGNVLRMYYNSQFSSKFQGHALAVKYSLPF